MAVLSPTTAIAAVQRLLADTGLPDRELLDTEQYDDAIQQAVGEYSRDRPRTVVADLAGAGTEYYRLATVSGWEEGSSAVLAVEYPAAAVGPGYVPSELRPGDDWAYYDASTGRHIRFLTATPAATELIRLRFTASHKWLAGTPTDTNTIPPFDLRAVTALAASRACIILATKRAGETEGKTGMDDIAYRDGQMRYKQQADAFLAVYTAHVRGEKSEPPPVAGGRRRWQSIPALERGASRIIRGV